MRYCNSCQKITSERPSYCNYCGKSYGQKLCSRGHPNPRGAEACSECGSRNLSTPHQRGSILMWLLIAFGLILPFTVLLILTLGYIGVYVQTMFQNPSGLLPLMLLGLVLGLLWLLWMLGYSALRRLLLGRDSDRNRK